VSSIQQRLKRGETLLELVAVEANAGNLILIEGANRTTSIHGFTVERECEGFYRQFSFDAQLAILLKAPACVVFEAGAVPTNICLWAAISVNLGPIESAIYSPPRGRVFGQPPSRPTRKLSGRCRTWVHLTQTEGTQFPGWIPAAEEVPRFQRRCWYR
jgi:hypothetical protein